MMMTRYLQDKTTFEQQDPDGYAVTLGLIEENSIVINIKNL